MKDQFGKYLESIGIIAYPYLERIDSIYDFCKQICPDEITGIFVTDYIKEDATREYENLWFFSERFSMEAKQFTKGDDFDITPIFKQIHYLDIKKQDYDMVRSTEKSRLHITFVMTSQVSGELKASKENCDHLRDIMKKHLLPNLLNRT
jgi:hypothetical protein